ncbi:MAG: carbohydrate porin [Candidatus Pacebacteria bacterium]|nr:carbohydrate porin [Candidatus Paceibacterota bacterium]
MCVSDWNQKIKYVGMSALLATLCLGAEAQQAARPDLLERETLTNNWFGTGAKLEEHGISLNLRLTGVYQYSLSGGVEQGIGRQSGSYDIELELDMDAMVGLPGSTVFILGEGSWQGGAGFDTVAIGSIFGVNDDDGGERTLDITELWYQQNLLDDRLRIRVGKLDLTGGFECRGCPVAFDGNHYANDETAEFLNGALVNNPSIPFPDNGLGAVLYVEPMESWYFSIGVTDAEADARETGFSTVSDGDSRYFYIAETGKVVHCDSPNGNLTGVYRIGVWNDHGPKERLDGNGERTDDVGFYLSLDQELWRENAKVDQGISVFARFGWADDAVNEIERFYSVGGQYKGFFPGRDNDIIGLGIAYANLNGAAGYAADCECAVECYYNCALTPWLQISPSLQWVSNPDGDKSIHDAIIGGIRLQTTF